MRDLQSKAESEETRIQGRYREQSANPEALLYEQGACFSDDAILELRVAHLRGAEHWAASLVVVDTGLTGRIGHDSTRETLI
jgi:hypothetical protein